MKPIPAPLKSDNNGGFVIHFKRPTARGFLLCITLFSIVIGSIIGVVVYGQKIDNAVQKVPAIEVRVDTLERIVQAEADFNKVIFEAILTAVVQDTSNVNAILRTAKTMKDDRIKQIKKQQADNK